MKKVLNIFFYKILNIYNPENYFNKIIRKLIVIYEKYKILYNKKILKFEEVILVYDCKVSSPTKGDFFHLLILLRTLQAINFKVKIIVLIGEYRDSWLRRYNKVSIKSHLDYMYSMTKILSLKNSPSLEYKTWLEYKEYEKEIDHNKTFILFNRKVKNRRPIYTHDINLINYLLNKNLKLQNRVLLKSSDIKTKIKKIPSSKYIAIGCRYESKKIGTSRNISKDLFIKMIKKLDVLLPEQKKIIVSDERGCKYFKKISKKNSLNCLFSKDFSSDFLGDGKIILNSNAFFQLEGGGIMEFAIFSKLPFLISTKEYTSWEYQWKKNHENSWHNLNQVYLRPSSNTEIFLSNKFFFDKLGNFLIN